MQGGPSIIRKPGAYRSNLELTNSLRSNFLAAKQEFASSTTSSTSLASSSPSSSSSPAPKDTTANGNGATSPAVNGGGIPATPTTKTPTPLSLWTSRADGDENTLYIPRIDWASVPGLQEDPAQYDITVKIFFLPTSPVAQRAAYARAALSLVRRELRVASVSLLIVSFPGMSFDGDCEWEADKHNATQGDDDAERATWRDAVEPLYREGLVRRLGVAEFGSGKLARFLEGVDDGGVKPEVDQINIKNCCNVPPPLVKLAKERGIELYVHSDCTDVLPEGTLRELLGQGVRGAGVLADPAEGVDEGLRGELTPQWVVKYTAVVRDRGVIENKGYFAGAGLAEE